MRLIDADKLKAHYSWWEGEGEVDERKRLFDSIVDQQPTVDAVPVVSWDELEVYHPKADGRSVEEMLEEIKARRKSG